MDRRKLIELTNLCLVYHDDMILVEEKEIGDGTGIVLPGGHVEPGESLCDSVIREIRQETGLQIRQPILCGVKNWAYEDGGRYIVMLYKTNQFSGELKSSSQGKVFWISRQEFEKLPQTWHMKTVLRLMDTDHLSEMFWDVDAEDPMIL